MITKCSDSGSVLSLHTGLHIVIYSDINAFHSWIQEIWWIEELCV